MKKFKIITLLLSILAIFPMSVYAEVTLADSPPMGWNSWNWWGKKDINEQVIRDTIDAMAKNGLKKAGYEYIIVDGGWRGDGLNKDGSLTVHKKRFPSGIKALSDYAHSKGFKFGLHTVPGSHDCGGDRVGSWGIEEIHVKQFIDWEVDFIKLDKCFFWLGNAVKTPKAKKIKNEGWLLDNNVEKAYKKWYDLLAESKRPIVLSASAYKFYDFYPKLTQMGRTTLDITAKSNGGAYFDTKPKGHVNVMDIAEQNNKYAKYAGKGYWNDPDMIITGGQGITYEQEKVHFALWSIMSSPLFIGSDPISMGKKELAILTNKMAITINQDPTEQGTRLLQKGKTEIWTKNLSDGKVAALLLNRDPNTALDIELSLKSIGLSGAQPYVDVYEQSNTGTIQFTLQKKVAASSGIFLLIGK